MGRCRQKDRPVERMGLIGLRARMRADSALSHLNDGELCIVVMKNEKRCEVRWSVTDWCFYFTGADRPTACRFEDIKEWMPASIKHHL